MKPAIFLLMAAAVRAQAPSGAVKPAGNGAAGIMMAQATLKPAGVVNTPEKTLIPFQVITDLEKQLNAKAKLTGGNDPMLLLGDARTLYLPGFGAIITQEAGLVVTPVISPFLQQITPQQAAQVHQRKLARLPLARQTVREMWLTAASMLTAVPENEQIVMAMRLLYQPWEDTTGLPGQIVVRASRKAGLAGVQTEEQ